jgi:hypothetical protein
MAKAAAEKRRAASAGTAMTFGPRDATWPAGRRRTFGKMHQDRAGSYRRIGVRRRGPSRRDFRVQDTRQSRCQTIAVVLISHASYSAPLCRRQNSSNMTVTLTPFG